jgi:hypothetical protein
MIMAIMMVMGAPTTWSTVAEMSTRITMAMVIIMVVVMGMGIDIARAMAIADIQNHY